MTPSAPGAVLEARNVSMAFTVRGRFRRARLTAVDDVSLTVAAGEVVAVVGESGSGKSTVARVLSQLYRPTSGTIALDGADVRIRGTRQFRRYCRQVQLIFQDPFASLNPLRTVRYHLTDPLRIHGHTGGDADAAATRLLERVKLMPADRYLEAYPHELSGGQRQRVSIARALAAEPRVLLADEPVSMLDVSIRLGILNLLADLKRDLGLGILYITHDIASARHFADRVLVMYAGQLVESGSAEDVTQTPAHPYTRLLIDSAPDPEAASRPDLGEDALRATAEPPSLINPPLGCRFSPRCPVATRLCREQAPPALPVTADASPPAGTTDGDGRWARCWLYATDPGLADRPTPGERGRAA